MSHAAKLVLILFLLVTGGFSTPVIADQGVAERIAQQLAAPGRDQYDSNKDPGRKPIETTEFIGVATGMTVLDLVAGAGYNSEIMAAAVGPNGIVYAQNPHRILTLIGGAHDQAMRGRLKGNRLSNVRYMIVEMVDMPFESNIDIAVWGTNIHDVYHRDGEAEVLAILQAIKRALKPGGKLAVSDHVGKAGHNNAELHRIQPAIVVALLEKAGFVIEAQSDLLASKRDDYARAIFDDDLRYKTDRTLIRAKKPD